MNYGIYTGDTTLPKMLIAAKDAEGNVISASDAGWTCRLQVLDEHRAVVSAERSVIDIEAVDGVDHFSAAITATESELLTESGIYYLSVEIQNLALNYRHTEELKFNVIDKP